MSFAQPWAWFWTLALIPVVMLYFLRKREQDFPVSALFLWEGVKPDTPRWVERLRARVDLLLFLQVLAVILAAAVLSQPVREVWRPAGATLLVLDASASTAAEGTREKILREAEEVVRRTAGPWAVILWAELPEILIAPTSERERVLAALKDYEPHLTRRPDLAQALTLLPQSWARVVVITDNPVGIQADEVVVVPRPENLGITAFNVRPSPDGLRYEAFLRILNATQTYKDAQIRIISEAGEFLARRLVPPEEEEEVVLVLPGARAGTFVAELRPNDAFPWDNVRYFVLGEGEITVRWEGLENRYLWAAIQAIGRVRRGEGIPDLVVAVSADLAEDPEAPVLLVGAGLPGAPRLGEEDAGPLRAESSSFLAHLSPNDWRVERVHRLALPPEVEVILWAEDIPVLFRWESARGRRVALALDLARSNLPLLPDFPVLIHHILTWLLPQEPGFSAVVGEAVELPQGFTVITEEGPVEGVWVPNKPGIFRMETAKGPRYLAVNVPWDAFELGEERLEKIPETKPALATFSLWPWFALPLLFLLVGEAVLFAKRSQ